VFDSDSETVLLPWRSSSYLCGLSLGWTSSNSAWVLDDHLWYSLRSTWSPSPPKSWWGFPMCVW